MGRSQNLVFIAVLIVATMGGCEHEKAICGNGVAEGAEPCDGFDLRGANCAAIGLQAGTLRCDHSCRIDTSGCNAGACGDGVKQIGEECDGTDTGGKVCSSFGFIEGTLHCTSSCFFDTTDCVGCGDGVLNPNTEECEETDLGETTCEDLGYHDGELACSGECEYDTSDCERYGKCGDDIVQVMYEDCEPWALDHTCRDLGFWGGDLECPDCSFVTTGCMRLVSLSAGANHVCGLDSLGTHWCWGRGTEGQLGNTQFLSAKAAVQVVVPNGLTFSQIQTGGNHSCALDQNGDAWCWGEGFHGQLGNADVDHKWSAPQPVVMPTGRSFVAISLGYFVTCALDDQGDAWCWGAGNSGEIGNDSTDDVDVPTAVSMPANVQFVKIDVGSEEVYALDTQGGGWSWGNPYPCGSGPQTHPFALAMPAGRTYQDIRVGGSHACALDDLGAAWCWGSDQWGQLGDGSGGGSCLYTAVTMPTASFDRIVSGSQFSCGLAPDGTVYCWGRNESGQLGTGNVTTTSSPSAVITSASFSELAVGQSFACALTAQGVAWCWGEGQYGALGNWNLSDAYNPVVTSEP